jgi:cobalt-zinc-cadmium efflux system outer membrane protein
MSALSLQLNLPVDELKRRGLYGRIQFRPSAEPPIPPVDELIRLAFANRPDLATQRLIVSRSDADIGVARASRYDDLLLLYQPYTFYKGIANVVPKNSYGWGLGVTVPLPIYNRQQGNIEKARIIASQARTQLTSMEKTVEADVRRAAREHAFLVTAVTKATSREEMRKLADVSPVIDDLMARYGEQDDEENYRLMQRLKRLISDDLENQLSKLDDLKIQHRRSMLKLNTAVGARLLP